MAFKGGLVIGPITFNTSGTATTTIGNSSAGLIALSSGASGATVTTASGPVTINSGTGTIGISTDASATTVNIGTGAAVKGVTLGSSSGASATGIQAGSAGLTINTNTNGPMTINSQLGTIAISNDAFANSIQIGTGAAAKTVIVGSTNTTSATTIQSGSGALSITSTNGALTINSGTGNLNISTDAAATTVSLGSGAAVKAVVVGSQNTTSITQVQSGSGGLALITFNNGNLNLSAGTGGASGSIQIVGASGNMDLVSPQITVANDATTSSVLVGAGAGAKTVTIGSSNTTSSTIINSGSGGIKMVGVFGVTTGATGVPVLVDNTGLLGTIASSIKFKENIDKIGSISSKIMKLNAVKFNYKKDEYKSIYYGLIAEEVHEVMPELVVYDEQDEINTIRYDQLIPLLLNEVQQLRKELNELKGI